MKKIFSFFAAILFAGSMFAAGAYSLVNVTEVKANGLYVFERNDRVLIGTTSNSAIQTTDSYAKAGLTGKETYVWKMEAAQTEGCFAFLNVALYEAHPSGHNYMNNGSSTTITFSNESTSDWKIEFTDGVALISNTSNSNRFLGETTAGSGAYKAYATNNLNNNGHDFKVYELQESTEPYIGVSVATVDFGTVKKDASVDAKEVAVSFGNLTGAVSFSGLTAPFSAEGTIAASGDKITISANPTTAGDFSQTLTVQSAADGKSATVTVTMKVLEDAGADSKFVLYEDALVEGDYLIVYDNAAMNTTVTSNRLQYIEVSPENNTIEGPDAAIIWHIAKAGDYWTLYNAEANKYAAGTGAKNAAQMLASGTDDKSLWSVAASDGKFEFTNKANAAASVNATLRRNGTYGFACYATSTGGALSLYKLETEAPAVAKPIISGEAIFFGETEITITCATEGAFIGYTLDGSEPWESETTIEYDGPFTIDETTTVIAIAQNAEEYTSAPATKTFTKAPSFDSFEDLIAADLADKTLVEVAFEDLKIDSIYTSSQSKRQGVYFAVGGTAYEIYYSKVEVPAAWEAAGTLSGTIRGSWTLYKGTWELVPSEESWNWTSLTYSAPTGTAISNTTVETKAVKVVRDGQIFILKNGQLYNLVGTVVK